MEPVLRFRGRSLTADDLLFIRRLLADHPAASRRTISAKLCEAWNWRQPNGVPCDMLARGLLLALARAGHIALPPRRVAPPNNVARHQRPAPRPDLRWDRLQGPLAAIQPLTFGEVRRTPEEPLFDSLIETYHFLGYVRPVGEAVKLLIVAGRIPVACMAFSSPPRHLGPRDRFIGWSPEIRRRNLHLLAYQTRFLILPWASGIAHLASHLLGRMARRIASDWQARYHHPVFLLETFVDPARHRATSYRAANWVCAGLTTGRGKNAPSRRPTRPVKAVWLYPLVKDFRQRLGVR